MPTAQREGRGWGAAMGQLAGKVEQLCLSRGYGTAWTRNDFDYFNFLPASLPLRLWQTVVIPFLFCKASQRWETKWQPR